MYSKHIKSYLLKWTQIISSPRKMSEGRLKLNWLWIDVKSPSTRIWSCPLLSSLSSIFLHINTNNSIRSNVSFGNSARWPIYIISSFDETKLSFLTARSNYKEKAFSQLEILSPFLFILKGAKTKVIQRGTGTQVANTRQVLGLGYVDETPWDQTGQGVYNSWHFPLISLWIQRSQHAPVFSRNVF